MRRERYGVGVSEAKVLDDFSSKRPHFSARRNFGDFDDSFTAAQAGFHSPIEPAAMATQSCRRCLPHSSLPLPRIALSAKRNGVPFSTSAAWLATPVKPKKITASMAANAARLKAKGSKSLKIKKKIPVKTGKPPMPGERKAMRKRIVLSNTNALEVAGLQDLNAELATEQGTVGKVVGLDGKTVDSLRAVGAFKTTQGWGMFRRPAILVRGESVRLSGKMAQAEADKGIVRMIVDGERGAGKSMLLLHAMATAFVRGWVVFNIPEGKSLSFALTFSLKAFLTKRGNAAQELTNAVTPYEPIEGTDPVLYAQNAYTANWLTQITKSNNAVLSGLTLSLKHELPIPIPDNITLARLCELGARDPDVAWPIFLALWSELQAPGRPPILFTLDSLPFIMQNSLYRSADFELIHAHDLAILRHFTDYFSGSKTLVNGGAVIGAMARSHAPISRSLELFINQTLEKQTAGEVRTKRDPYEKKYDLRSDKVLGGGAGQVQGLVSEGEGGLEVMKLKGLSKLEARGLMEYWAQSGVLRSKVDERTVAEKWALAGNGIVGEIERGALRMRI
jgi:small subunit ribosomal protein S29